MENEYNTRKIQENLLEVLSDIDSVCRKNNIYYSLYAGTLIGAIRHQGFIPWDDDVDIVFERKEYEKFNKVFLDDMHRQYLIKNIVWVPRLIKLDENKSIEQSMYIDIFILDNVPDNRLISGLKLLILKIIQGMLKTKVPYKKYNWKGKVISLIPHFLGKLFNSQWKLSKYDSVSMWGNKDNTQKIAVYNPAFKYLGLAFPKSVIDEYRNVEFENKKLMIMNGYDEVLTVLYGDYMTPPPIGERIPSHNRQ